MPTEQRTRPKLWKWIAAALLACAALYPTDFQQQHAQPRHDPHNKLVMRVEKYGRHINTVLPILAAVILRDTTALKQGLAIVATGTVATHGPKRALNDVTILGTRLGQRPSSPNSKHNMPSGHSALASAGAYFTVSRYSRWFGLIVWPVLILTMYARYMLDAHTISATIAGALTGLLVASLFTKRYTSSRRRVMLTAKRFFVAATARKKAALS